MREKSMSDEKPTCFIIMPITTPESCYQQYKGDKDHFEHVQEWLFKPAIEKAGFIPVLPKSTGSENIQAEIIEKLTTSDMVLCDMSILNANVFFEFGVRTSLNKPVTLVVDDKTPKIPFDVGTINREKYKSSLNPWELESEVAKIANHIKVSADKAQGENALWKRFKIQETAEFSTSDVTPDDKLNLLIQLTESIQATVNRDKTYKTGGFQLEIPDDIDFILNASSEEIEEQVQTDFKTNMDQYIDPLIQKLKKQKRLDCETLDENAEFVFEELFSIYSSYFGNVPHEYIIERIRKKLSR
jgi:hypothetical protein